MGVGRVNTPTLAIVCLRELEIRTFKQEDYFEVEANAQTAGGTFGVTVGSKRQAPPRLYDLPALQKTCAQK